MLGENAVRRSAAPISSAIEWKRFLKISSSMGSRRTDISVKGASVLDGSDRCASVRRVQKRKNCVDMAVTLPQYLVLIGGPIPRVGFHSENGRQCPNRSKPCKGKSSRRQYR